MFLDTDISSCRAPCRLGKVLEDLDAMAGAISYKHCDDGKPDSAPLTIVTASVDRIDFLKPWGIRDLRLSGHVTYVGFSSMEGMITIAPVIRGIA
jgi:acyl-coenzyme A thioesterase 9